MASIKEKIAAFWGTKIGKIVIIAVLVIVTNALSGGIGNIAGCAKQQSKVNAISEQLQNEQKLRKVAEDKTTDLEKEIKRLKKNPKCK